MQCVISLDTVVLWFPFCFGGDLYTHKQKAGFVLTVPRASVPKVASRFASMNVPNDWPEAVQRILYRTADENPV